jgi:hypothetical protein
MFFRQPVLPYTNTGSYTKAHDNTDSQTTWNAVIGEWQLVRT